MQSQDTTITQMAAVEQRVTFPKITNYEAGSGGKKGGRQRDDVDSDERGLSATKTFCYVGNEISPRRLLTDSAVTELVMVSVGQIC